MLTKLIKAMIVSFLIGLAAAAIIVLFPLFFLLWGIYNRQHISLWLSTPLVLMSAIIYLQLYIFFKGLLPSLALSHNPSIYYGIFISFPFLLTRIISLRPNLTMKKRYLTSVVLFVLLLGSSLVLVVLAHYLFYKRHVVNYLLIAEIVIFLWVSLVIFLFVKYPEDALIKEIQQYGSRLFRWVHS